jgi:predicted DNA binding CopG/RHH family protein
MKAKKFVKNHKKDIEMYKDNSFEIEKSLKAREQRVRKKKLPTSIALDEDTILKLKSIAEDRGIPYQVLMRSYILKGLKDEEAS